MHGGNYIEDSFEKIATYLLGNHQRFSDMCLAEILDYDEVDRLYHLEIVEKCWRSYFAALNYINNNRESIFKHHDALIAGFEHYLKKTYITSKAKLSLLDKNAQNEYKDDDISLLFQFWEQCYSWIHFVETK